MYPCYQDNIAANKHEKFPSHWIVGENLLHLATWILAGWLLFPVSWAGVPVATIAWVVLVVVVQILLKKHNCSGCYYYGKSCHLGWGKLSALMFKQDSGDPGTGMRWSLFYILSPPTIVVSSIVVGLLMPVGMLHWGLLGGYVVLNAAMFPIRSKGCRMCAMRLVCPGSAYKKE